MDEAPLLNRRHAGAAIASWGLAGLPARATAAADLEAAIDHAGRQRMLTQRIVKAYCQVGLQVTPELSRQQLAEALRRFDAQLTALARVAPDTATQRALRAVGPVWRPFRRIAAGAVQRDGARRLWQLDEAVLGAAQDVVAKLELAAGTPQARLVNLAGRQRMLSQRLAKLYMLRAWGLETPELRLQMERASTEFVQALATLTAAAENTAAIARELEAVALQWEWFARAVAQQGAQSYALLVADASESMLGSMDLVTGMYAELARR